MVADQPAGKTGEDRRQKWCAMAAMSSSRCRGRGAEGIVPGHSTAHCGIAPTAGCDAGVRRLIVTVFESKRQETCALMAEKAEVCGTDCGKSATPAENHLSIPRLTHDPHCQCGRGGHPDA